MSESFCSVTIALPLCALFFFFNDPAPTEIYTLSLHDALPIWPAETFWPGWTDLCPTIPLTGATMVAYCKFSWACSKARSEEHTSELQSRSDLVCRLLLEKKKKRLPQRTQRPARSTPSLYYRTR